VPGGGGGRRLGAAAAAVSADAFDQAAIAAYSNVIIYGFLFVYVLALIDDLEDPFEYSLYALVPRLRSEGGNFKMLTSGSADIDVFPLLEAYARLASHAALTDVVGPAGGLAASFHLSPPGAHAHAEIAVPSELVDAFDERSMPDDKLAARDHYRDTLADATFTVLRHVDAARADGGGRDDAAAARAPSHHAAFVSSAGKTVRRAHVTERAAAPLLGHLN